MHCHESTEANLTAGGAIALVGHPNVGKSVLFQRLTGMQSIVSNYPGTTVEVTRGAARAIPDTIVVDTPGVVTLPPHTEDEQVTARVLLEEPLKAVVQVGDAKNLRRTLLLTAQLAEMGLPLVLALNMQDEADARGVAVKHDLLSRELGLPVISTIATRGAGLEGLIQALQGTKTQQLRLHYPPEIEEAIAGLEAELPRTSIASRALALLWLCEDPVTESWLRLRLDTTAMESLRAIREGLRAAYDQPPGEAIQKTRLAWVEAIASAALTHVEVGWRGFSQRVGNLAVHPIWGVPILALVLYGLYWFVGVLAAGTLVDFLENVIFGTYVNPWLVSLIERISPFALLTDFLVGKYGLWTMGATYALALILPIVTAFFLAFGVLEDSGYLPRLAALTNRIFAALGLNGKAVLPMVLGLGCVTMATLTTRVLESKRDRLLVTLLLALGIPCSAQLGVVMGMLAGISFSATLIWSAVVVAVILVVGWLAARVVPGERSMLLVELPPMRWPVSSNVLLKTLARLEWYLKEVVPLFLLGSAVMFLLDKTGVLGWVIRLGEPLIAGWLGLPAEASAAFLLGFLRRDFGATGLFIMESQGLLTPLQVVVAMVTITLFIPCIAAVLIIARERGWKMAWGMIGLVFPLAFLIGGLLYRLLFALGWGLA